MDRRTYKVILDGEKNLVDDDNVEPQAYRLGWTEEYIDNFMLNRYANIRITDETLYLANNTTNTSLKREMQDDLKNRLICILPSPIITMLGIDINKSDY